MRELDRALGDIRDLRRQLAQSTEFRGYGPLALAATAGFAVLGGAAQAWLVPQPAAHALAYVALWSTVAVLSLAAIATEALRRAEKLHSGLADEMIRMAAQQFLPSFAAGMLLTGALLRFAPPQAWMLPGLWQILYGVGVLSSVRFLPRGMVLGGVWFLATGLACVALGDARAMAPATMATAYGVGQMMMAAVLRAANRKARDGEEFGEN